MRIVTKADNQFRQFVDDPFASVLVKSESSYRQELSPTFSPLVVLRSLSFVMIKILGPLTAFTCQENDATDVSLAVDSACKNLAPFRHDGNRLMLASVFARTSPPLTVTSGTLRHS